MNPFAPRTYGSMHRVTDRVYLFRNIVNSVVIIGDDMVAVVDTQVNASLAERLLQQVRELVDKPLRYVINTHYHWDHTGGNHVFKRAGAQVISSQRTRAFLEQRTPRQRAFLESRGFRLGCDPYLADDTVADVRELDLGNQRLCLQHLGGAETDDAMSVYLPQEECVVTGDSVMTGSFPIFGQPVMDEGLMGTTTWLETIANIEALGAKHLLPGHGPLAYEAELTLLKRIQTYFLEEVAARTARQMPLPELLADLESQLPAWITEIPVTWGTPRYAILRVHRGLVDADEPGWQHYKPSAIPEGDPARVDAVCAESPELSTLHGVARECEEGGDVGTAVALARYATTAFPESPAAWVFFAELLIRSARTVASVIEKGDFFIEALRALEHALELDPDDASAHLGMGRFMVMRAYRNGDHPEEGMAHLRRVIEILSGRSPGPARAWLAQAHFYTGMGHRTRGEEGQAVACFQTALEWLPSFPPAILAQQG